MNDTLENRTATSPIEPSGERSTRLYYLDWLRVLLILGVFLFHAVHPFDMSEWHIKNAEQSIVLTAIMLMGLYPWGMPLFFLVAGAASRFALRRRSGRQYALERVTRLFIPFIVGSILLSPLQVYLEDLSKGDYTGSFLGFIPEWWAERASANWFSPHVFGRWGVHLWFLGFLFAYSLLALPLFLWSKQKGGQRFIASLARLVEKRGGILLFIIPLVLVRFLIQPIFPKEHGWTDFAYTFVFFMAGYIIYADDGFLKAIHRDRQLLLAGGIVSLIALLGLFATGQAYDWAVTFTVPWSNVLWLVFSVTSWCWAIYVLCTGMLYLNFSNKWLDYGNETIMPFFLLHQPVIVVIAYFVVQWDAGILLKLPIVVASSFVVAIALVEIVIRRIKLLGRLFGMKA